MLKLGGKLGLIPTVEASSSTQIFRLSTNSNLPGVLRQQRAFLIRKPGQIPLGFAHYFILQEQAQLSEAAPAAYPLTTLPDDYFYLNNDDIVALSQDRRSIRVLFRNESNHNSILLTEQCNHYCLMCSQPPKSADDSWLIDEVEQVIPLIPQETREIGFTGGEPTLRGDRFLKIISMMKSYLPRTAVHILSNGRTFASQEFTRKYASINHHDIMIGIPLYSDDAQLHDYIVQAKGAFDETLRGILNLKQYGQRVEIRVVLHQQSIKRLPELCEFIGRNLLFADHVALMGLEMMGFTRANLDALWIDPEEYRDILSEAVSILAHYRMNVSVYNHQLCLINDDVIPFYRKSISDWKNEYAPECTQCSKREECGGFFSSGIKHGYSQSLKPFK
ncbi:His-Xaa-Ser system radical SAM maturase HxsC [Pseudomonas sp. LTJR-52]|uniref:His-Xaa-Ser system radical SAM maturase HxsC n=1 Tax=Pseudomonas sp. LTJR-52 TaxID=2479392 RepID=UPI000EFBAB26|nr:His-Xaa-Ser system radical SAM maturase HxsC [Pseudomonas sp. LTJR-52]AYN96916.1 His-Xaa-Ser system radical SAM maturase HxsC [Pseudomonas sp. LTJR-52]